MTEIIWTAGAGRELQEVYEQLEDYHEGDGVTLLEDLERNLALLAAQPFMGGYFEKPTRKLLIGRRYGVIYSPENRGGCGSAGFCRSAPRLAATTQTYA